MSPLSRLDARAALRRAGAAALALGALTACGPAPAPIPVVELTIADLHTALTEGRTTCRMVVQAHLNRIEAYEDRINAVTVTNPRALARADSLDALLAAGGVMGTPAAGPAAGALPPLFCVPMLVKDNFDTGDMVTTGGSIALRESTPPDDATMVRRIREAGAVVVAKTNMAEWAFSPRQTVSSSFDTTRNAYALDRVPAGSSGGTASGIAASFGLIGLGSDTGNSIRGPSAHLALVGIRSTLGLTARDGVIPLSFDRDIAGPMGRTVEDVARVFSVVAGYDPADPYTEPVREGEPVDYVAGLNADALRGARIGVLEALVEVESADPAVVVLFDAAVAELERLGATVVRVDTATLDIREQLSRPNMFCPRFRYDMHEYLASLGPGAPLTDVVDVLETGEYHPHVERELRSDLDHPVDVHPADWENPCPDYADNPGRQAYLQAVEEVMDAGELDALVYPSWLNPPAPIDRAREEYRGDNSQLVAPATGMPAVTVPMGFLPGGLPSGLQILGRPYDDGLLLALAYAYEQGTGHRQPPAGFPELEGTGR